MVKTKLSFVFRQLRLLWIVFLMLTLGQAVHAQRKVGYPGIMTMQCSVDPNGRPQSIFYSEEVDLKFNSQFGDIVCYLQYSQDNINWSFVWADGALPFSAYSDTSSELFIYVPEKDVKEGLYRFIVADRDDLGSDWSHEEPNSSSYMCMSPVPIIPCNSNKVWISFAGKILSQQTGKAVPNAIVQLYLKDSSGVYLGATSATTDEKGIYHVTKYNAPGEYANFQGKLVASRQGFSVEQIIEGPYPQNEGEIVLDDFYLNQTATDIFFLGSVSNALGFYPAATVSLFTKNQAGSDMLLETFNADHSSAYYNVKSRPAYMDLGVSRYYRLVAEAAGHVSAIKEGYVPQGLTTVNVDLLLQGTNLQCVDLWLGSSANYKLCAETITESPIGSEVFIARGNININDVLHFQGEQAALTFNRKTGEIMATNANVAIPDVDLSADFKDEHTNFVLYNGPLVYLELHEEGKLRRPLGSTMDDWLQFPGFPIQLEDMILLPDGISMSGEFTMPDWLDMNKVRVSNFKVTKSDGVDFVVDIADRYTGKMFGKIALEKLTAQFKYESWNNFSFKGKAKTSFGAFLASNRVFNNPSSIEPAIAFSVTPEGMVLDSIGLIVEGPPVPFGNTGFEVYGLGMGLANFEKSLAVWPTTVSGMLKIQPMGAQKLMDAGSHIMSAFRLVDKGLEIRPFDLIGVATYDFADRYTFTGKFTGRVLEWPLAEARLNFSSSLVNDIDLRIDLCGEMFIPSKDYPLISGTSAFNFSFFENSAGKLQLKLKGNNSLGVRIPKGLINGWDQFPNNLLFLENDVFGVTTSFGFEDLRMTGNFNVHGLCDLTASMELVDINNLKVDMSGTIVGFDGASSCFYLDFSQHGLNSAMRSNQNQVRTPSAVPSASESFAVTSSTPTLILRSVSRVPTDGSLDFNVILPTGQLITPTTASSFPNIAFKKDEIIKESYYFIQTPAIGNYQVSFAPNAPHSFYYYTLNNKPSIEITSLQQTVSVVKINWRASDPDDAAIVALYFGDKNQKTRVLIQDNIAKDINSYSWDITNIRTGQYYITAEIRDGKNAPVAVQFSAPVTIQQPDSPPAPTTLKVAEDGDAIKLQWSRNTDDSEVTYIVSSEHEGDVSFVFSKRYSIKNTDNIVILKDSLVSGKQYQFVVRAVKDGKFSLPSNVVKYRFKMPNSNSAPDIISTNFPVQVFEGLGVDMSYEAFDIDGNPLTFSVVSNTSAVTKPVPGDVRRNPAALILWTPSAYEVGPQLMYAVVTDSHGSADTVSFVVSVLSQKELKPSLSFNQSYYFSDKDHAAIISVSEKTADRPNVFDSVKVNVEIRSTLFPIWLMETSSNSGVFTGGVYLPGFNLQSEDTLRASYMGRDFNTIQALAFYKVVLPCGTVTGLQNSDFETPGLEHWTVANSGSGKAISDTYQKRSGTRSAYITGSGSAFTTRLSQKFCMSEDGTYRASVWKKAGGTYRSAQIIILVNGVAKGNASLEKSNVWSEAKIENIKVKVGDQVEYVILIDANGGAWFSLDDAAFANENVIHPDGYTSTEIDNVIVFPNPATDRVTISVKGLDGGSSINVRIVDSNGATVYLAETRPVGEYCTNVIETGALKPGIYVVKILYRNQELATRRLIVQ